MQQVRSLGLKEAEMIVDAAIKANKESEDAPGTEGYPMGIAVVDACGNLLCFKRMDGAFSLACRVSVAKAQSAIELLRDTWEQRKISDSRDVDGYKLNIKGYEFASANHTEIPGGCVIKTSDGSVVGAIGTSGRSPAGDEKIAKAGVKAFEQSEFFQV